MRRLMALVIAAFVFCSLALAQTGTGSITGTVTDSSGAVIPGARVVATNTATGVETAVSTSNAGIYQVLQLVPGVYNVTVEFEGFKTVQQSDVRVQVGDRLSLDIALTVGSQSEAVTVTAEVPLLRTEDAQQGEVINNNFIMNMPQINRNPLNLIRLAGNVQGADTGLGADTRINGGRTSGIEFFVDGMPMTSGRGHSVTALRPGMDAVQEFKVVTNGISAEFGRLSGGYVEVATRGGTNDIHGQVYEYMYNNMFNANSWRQNALGGKKTHFRQNNYGFTVGGPVYIPKVYNGKNKTFFYFDYDIYRRRERGSLVTMHVPTEAERAGDFSNTVYTIGGKEFRPMMYDPTGPQREVIGADGKPTGVWERMQLLGGDGRHVPTSRISPTSAAILKLLPMPNRTPAPGTSSAANYIAPRSNFSDSDRIGTRIDHVFNEKHRIFGRLSLLDSNGGDSNVGGPLFVSSTNASKGGRFATLNYDWSYTPTLLFNVRGGVNHTPNTTGRVHPEGFTAAQAGMPAVYQSILGANNIPNIQIDFMEPTYYGNPANSNTTVSTVYNMNFTGTKVHNRHILKFGYEHRRYYDNFQDFGGTATTTFTTNPVHQFSGDHGFGSNEGRVNSLGSFLLGINSWNIITGFTTRAMAMNYHAAFIQDDFKVNSKLTVNVGLRWDVETPTTERHDKLYFWDPDAPSPFSINPGWSWEKAIADAGLPASTPKPAWVTNGLPKGAVRIANTPEFPGRTGQTVNPHQFAPRLGVAYQARPTTVLRASAGLMYLSTTGDPGGFSKSNSSLSLGNSADAGWHASNDGQRNYISTWENPFPAAGMVSTYQRDNFIANQQSSKDPGVSVFNRHMHMPREYVWQGAVQQELPWKFVTEIGYTGNRGLGLLAPFLISRFPKEFYNTDMQGIMTKKIESPFAGQTLSNNITGPTQYVGILQYPYPYFGPVNVLGSNLGASTYHAMNLRMERRFGDGMSFLMNYTLGRNLDNTGGPEAGSGGINTAGRGGKTYQSVDDFRSTWGLSAIDQKHRLTLAYTAQFPFGRGRRWLGSPEGFGKVLDGIVGGWEFSGYTIYRTGTPIRLDASAGQNTGNIIKAETTFGRWTSGDHNLSNPSYTGDLGVLVSDRDPKPAVTRFDKTKVTDAKAFVYGDLPSVYGDIRNPPFTQTDLSLMKNFYLWSEGRYLQVRAEAENAFNIRGFGAYQTKIGDANFGLITGAGNTERRIQLSARIVF